MAEWLTGRQEQIAELYYQSQSVKFGEFRLSVHVDSPDLPLSPYYLHYPKPGEPGSELLPELYQLVGDEFYEICETHDPPIKPKRLAGVPKGALPLANAHATHYDDYPNNLLVFGKVEEPGKTTFIGPEGEWKEGDEIVIDEDHTSGGRNKRLIKAAAEQGGLAVHTMLTVVDRQQGGVANMAAEGVDLISIFTVEELLGYGVAAGHTDEVQLQRVREYIAPNQF